MRTWAWIETSRADDRLVAHDQVGLEHERARDADALALPAGELVRVAPRVVRRQADQLHDPRHAVPPFLRGRQPVDAESLGDAGADRGPRVERRERILEDDLHPAPERLEPPAAELRDVGPVEDDAAAGRLDQAQQHAADGGLAAAGLADEAERLAPADGEADVVDGLDLADLAMQDAADDGEVLGQVLDLDERRRRATRFRMRRSWRGVTGGRVQRGARGGVPSASW